MTYHLKRFALWLNRDDNALNLTAVWGLVMIAAIILSIEFQS